MTVDGSESLMPPVPQTALGGPSAPDAPTAAPGPLPLAREASPRDAVSRRNPDCFHALLHHLPWPSSDPTRCIRSVAFTSCYRGEGVSTVALHSAVAAARSGSYRVLVVDANLGEPSLHRALGLARTPGLAEAILGLPDCDGVIQRTHQPNLSALAAGRGDASRVYEAADRFAQLVADLKRAFDLAVFDMPPCGRDLATSHLFRLFDGVVLVIEDARVRWEVAQRATKRLRQSGANLLGAVLNKRHEHIPNWLYRRL